MTPPARVKARRRLWLLYGEVMERFYDMFDHPHKFIIRGRWNHVLRHKVANGLRDIVETERKHCRGAPNEVFRRDGFPSSEPHHVVSVREGEVAQVFLGWLGSQEHAELALKPPVVEKLVVSGGASP